MKKLILILVFSFYLATSYSQKEIKIEEVKDYVGDTVKVCTRIFGTFINDNSKGDGTYLFAGGNFPEAPLTILIRNENRRYFDYKPEKDLKDRDVCITGRLELIKDKVHMIINKQGQIDIK
jgi:hypothetical protein